MYAIRSYYGYFQEGTAADKLVPEGIEGMVPYRGAISDIRITSYNVCYTKLLRLSKEEVS